MSSAAAHFAEGIGALTEAADSLPAIRERLDELVRQHGATVEAAAAIAVVEGGLHPDHAYSNAAASRFLGVKAATVRKLSPILLPRVRGGRVLGIDVMAYRGDVTPEAARAYKAAKLAAVQRLRQSA